MTDPNMSEVERLREQLADAFMRSGWATVYPDRSRFERSEDRDRAAKAYALDLANVALSVLLSDEPGEGDRG